MNVGAATRPLQLKIPNFRRLQLKLELVCDKRNKFGIGGFAFGIGYRVAEEALEGVQVAAVPGYFDGVADGPLDAAGGGLECFGYLGVQYLGDGVDGVPTAHQRLPPQGGFIALFIPFDNYCLLAYSNDTKSQHSGQARNL